MGCPRNIKKGWFWNYEGPCEYEDVYIQAAGSEGKFHVAQKCVNCKSSIERFFVSSQKMIRDGYDIEKLNSMSFHDNFGKRPEDLK